MEAEAKQAINKQIICFFMHKNSYFRIINRLKIQYLRAMLDSMIAYFDSIPSSHRALIMAGGITFFWLIEGAVPLFRFRYQKWSHAGLNLFFTLTTIVINFAFATVIVRASDWVVASGFGILPWLGISSGWAMFFVGLLALDLVGAYLIHLIEHKIKVMWKFHMVHHADTHVDTTTANRHHPGESVFRAIFTLIGVVLCGAPMWLVMVYQSISVVLSQFNHANISLPASVDRAISYLIVSPNMHKIHHHYMRPQTDSNYGNIFSIWDRLFGTYQDMNVSEIRYGLDVLSDETDGNMSFQLGIPFNKSIKTDE
jgi:sterol desaturase/sphingolipid hydroxylase (fatty acid hydroxylase superfamily)